MSQNLKAFLDMLGWSEGTDNGIQPTNNLGYDVIVGGNLFTSYDDHPRIMVQLRPGLASTAAGRYQLLARYFDAYKASLHLPDFSPSSQDAIAIQQIRERGALEDIEAGRVDVACEKCSNIWASLPGNSYGQHQQSLDRLVTAFINAGGVVG